MSERFTDPKAAESSKGERTWHTQVKKSKGRMAFIYVFMVNVKKGHT